MPNMVSVRFGYAYGSDVKSGFKYNRGTVKNKVSFDTLSPVDLTGFLRWLFLKGFKIEQPNIKYYMQMYSIKPLWILNKKQYNELVFFLSSKEKEYSLLYKQYETFKEGN